MCIDGGHEPGCPNYRHSDCNSVDRHVTRLRDSLSAMTAVAILELVAIVVLGIGR